MSSAYFFLDFLIQCNIFIYSEIHAFTTIMVFILI